jgi:hypothetical protein
VTLKAPLANVLPEGKKKEDFSWSGPSKATATYPIVKGVFGETHVSAIVEVHWYYNGKYISDFGATITQATLESITYKMDIELSIEHFDANPPGGIAIIDWTLTFRQSHYGTKTSLTARGRAQGDGNGTAAATAA